MKRPLTAAMAVLLIITAGGCGRSSSYEVTATFADVLDLVPRSAVRVNDVTVGSVEEIKLDGWRARVRMSLDSGVRLPANVTAELRQSSLLGEKFVSLAPPVGEPGTGNLADGAHIPIERTGRTAEVEEVLAALGLLLNGGGLAQLRTVNAELGKALKGRSPAVNDLLTRLDTLIGGLDAQKADITRAIDALDSLSGRLAGEKETIGRALDAADPGLAVLADQRAQLTEALTALSDLSTVGTRVIDESRDATLASLAELRPILTQLVKAGDDLPQALNFLLTYPFPANVQGPITANFVNLHATLELDAAVVLANLLVNPDVGAMEPSEPADPAPDNRTKPSTPATTTPPVVPGGPQLPNVPGVPLPSISVGIPGVPLPTLPGLPLPLPTRDCGPLGLLTGCDQP
ncbi:MCE family protein [Actinoplanes sp. NBRC 103695]|uniref:MCE family protein n=1 Tax=Actinoplanes sp. NBRC 103695 TaxID=3032202 RepID=UPI0024A2630C|nr:MCE family protein [Actinoplanes sp. NBRC 103695]GLY97863.1 ABC transporter substrate-binding protein [Actinoplanes sp. NBRC 103695]